MIEPILDPITRAPTLKPSPIKVCECDRPIRGQSRCDKCGKWFSAVVVQDLEED